MRNKQPLSTVAVVILGCWMSVCQAHGHEFDQAVQAALDRAGDNRNQLEAALEQVADAERPGLQFLIAYMPDRDLQTLSAQFLLDNVKLGYQAWNEAPWKDQVPQDVFLNNVLPYASINERRDDWRKDFYDRCKPLVQDATTPAQAAAILNQKIFPMLEVRYSTQRNRADQGPYESIESGLASCTGLSILLIDACRAVGVPARFAGTPLWTNKSGNHSWVEIWDNGWHFTGAAEPSGDKLNQAWFTGRAATALRDDPLHAIYAVSYKHTPQQFPLVWDRSVDYVFAVNVTDRYTRLAEPLPEGKVEVMFRAVTSRGQRLAVPLSVTDASGKVVFEGTTKDERFDANDHLIAVLQKGDRYEAQSGEDDHKVTREFVAEPRNEPITIEHNPAPAVKPEPRENPESGDAESPTAIDRLESYLEIKASERPPLEETPLGQEPLTDDQAATAVKLLWAERAARLRKQRSAELEARELIDGDLKMPFFYKVFGDPPADGRSLFISMHGGGGAPSQVNDRQWENQKGLYSLDEGVYLVPRAPTNTWNMWHQGHIDRMFDRLIENLVLLENVNPDRVYLMGYSAGGDGVFQLAPRMADRFAAAAMMAGHPNETSPLGLRNLPFTLHMGGKDSAYRRNEVAESWQKQLAELQQDDPDGYPHLVKIYPDKGHWMDREDAAAIPWMQQYRRNRHPARVVWKQDDVTHQRFYWLALPDDQIRGRSEIRAELEGQDIRIQSNDVHRIAIRLNDEMLDLDASITITMNDQQVFQGLVQRSLAVVSKTLDERGDPTNVYCAELTVERPDPIEPNQ